MPTALVQRQKALGLDAIDLNIILHLAGYWWEVENLPHPSVETIALAIDVKPRTIQRHVKALEGCGYVKRVWRSTAEGRNITNGYDLSGLVKACEPFSQEHLEAVQQRKVEAAARSTRKRPKLALVKPKAE